ncbi:MAG: MBL fold metallo-hydrolase [Bacteroidetes bacterium]|nr:MBL fold metallo-hydrolase [Bacteroidota bacterium]
MKSIVMKTSIPIFIIMATILNNACSQVTPGSDIIETGSGKLTITCLGHSSLLFEFQGKYIYVDPWSTQADFSQLPKADLILITHHHHDHLDTNAIALISKPGTAIISTRTVCDLIHQGKVMKNGDLDNWNGIGIESVPAYNTTAGRDQYHPKGRDNGYILTIGNKKILVAGDTEDTPELKALKNIDIAFLPMNQPYTMTPAQVETVVTAIKPGILYSYHTGETEVNELKALLAGKTGIEFRIRSLK